MIRVVKRGCRQWWREDGVKMGSGAEFCPGPDPARRSVEGSAISIRVNSPVLRGENQIGVRVRSVGGLISSATERT